MVRRDRRYTVRGCGRTPGPRGREAEMASQLHETLHAKLLSLPDEIEIFPGHKAGSACGVGLSGKPSSTLGFEKRWNPLLSKGREDFVAAAREVPPELAEMERMLSFNRGL